MPKTRTEIFIETTEIYIVKRKRCFVRAWCEICQREVSMLPPSEAALLTFQDTNAIFSLVNTNQLHFRYLEKEDLLICLRSLCLT